jgi:hypothetical protein
MYFHIVGIKEDENKKYNMDIVILWESEAFIKDFLHHHNIVILNFSEYKESLQDFWQLQVDIKYKTQNVEITSYLTDIKSATYNFMMIWFDVSYINFIWKNKLSNQEVLDIIKSVWLEVKESKEKFKQQIIQEKEQERKIYKNEKLQKFTKISQKVPHEVENLLLIIWENVSQDKIRDIKTMSQNLIKIKMWRNIDKMSEILENIYHKIYEIEKEYFSKIKNKSTFPIPWSIVSDIDIMSEISKLNKAKNIKEIWASRDSDDNYYLSFETTGVYFKFLFKDIKNKLKNLFVFFNDLFNYFELFFLYTIIILSLVFRFNKISYSLSENLYTYVFMTKIW